MIWFIVPYLHSPSTLPLLPNIPLNPLPPLLPPRKLLSKPQQPLRLRITDRRHLPLQRTLIQNLALGTKTPQPINRHRLAIRQRILIIHRIERLEPQAVRRNAPVDEVPQIPRVDVAPAMHFPVTRALEVRGHGLLVAAGRDHCSEPKTVDVDGLAHGAEPLLERVCDALHADFGGGVDVHGFCGGGFCDWEVREGDIAFGVGDAIDGDGGGEDDLLDAQFARGFYYGVGGEGVDAEGFVVGDAVGLGDAWIA